MTRTVPKLVWTQSGLDPIWSVPTLTWTQSCLDPISDLDLVWSKPNLTWTQSELEPVWYGLNLPWTQADLDPIWTRLILNMYCFFFFMKVIVLVTDGLQTRPNTPYAAANKLKSRGFEIYTVGAGQAKSHYRELERLKNKAVFFVPEATDLPKLITEVAQSICPSE